MDANDDALASARGILNGVIASIPVWVIILLITWRIL
jgi:hypothetical protein